MSIVTNSRELVADARSIRWREETDPLSWDRELARLGGHPLQSALWGDARREAEGIPDRRFIAEGDGGIAMMARIELRSVPFVNAAIGWIPRGPTGMDGSGDAGAFQSLKVQSNCRPALIVTDRWEEAPAGTRAPRSPETIWIDLTLGRDKLWQDLDRRVRQSVGRGTKSNNITVERSRSKQDIDRFSALSEQISDRKKFKLALSPAVVAKLLCRDEGASAGAHLFVARVNGAFAAAALIFRLGTSVHYTAGGTDREFSRERVGEVLHWSIMEWAIGQGMSLYDLEGIDRIRNPGTFAFKKKLGGREVVLAGKSYHALSGLGRAVAVMDRCRDRFDSPFRAAAVT